jgi:hypothetical protein
MTTINHNEEKYIAASVLVTQNKTIYKDFGFDETPYLPILYSNLYKMLKIGSYYLLIVKLISFLSLCLAAMTLFFITRHVSNSIASSLSIVALFLLNMNIVGPAAQVSNYIIPLTLSLGSFYLFEISFDTNETKPFGIAIAGLLLAIAVGIRLMYATVIIPFAGVILFHLIKNKHSSIAAKRIITHVLLPFTIGVIVGLLPMLFFLSDFQSFYFNNLGFHFINGYWSQINGFSHISLLSKLSYIMDIFSRQ